MTRQLAAVLDVVSAAADHPTADEVFRRVQKQIARVSLGTVYRNLQKLVAGERIRFVSVPNHAGRYDAMLDPHDHFLCQLCGRLSDLTPNLSVQVRGLQAKGYSIESHALTVYGSCPHCSKIAGAEKAH